MALEIEAPGRRPQLTIAIPTYNRAVCLAERLRELLPQLTAEVALVVFDNGSTDNTSALFTDEFAAARVEYRRWPANLGMMRNFIRCFEETEGAWLWILGDDDAVRTDAVATILSLIQHPTAGVISTTTNCNLNVCERLCATLDEFLGAKSITDLCHVSGNLYRRSAIVPHYGCLTPSAFTVANIAVISLRMLDAGNAPLLLSSQTMLVDRRTPRRWSVYEVALGFSLIPEFLSRPQHQSLAARGIWKGTRWMLMWAVMDIADTDSGRRWRKLCNQVDANLAGYGITWWSVLWGDSCGDLRNVRRGLLLRFLSFLPVRCLRWLGALLRRRTGGDQQQVVCEFVEQPSIFRPS